MITKPKDEPNASDFSTYTQAANIPVLFGISGSTKTIFNM
jgi:hypothetical protein